jgi:hypothetical protein
VPLSILVLDPRGNAVWGDAVFVSAEGEPGGRGVTDANGRFQMSAADDVSYTVRVEHFEDREFNTEVTGVRADGRDAIVRLVHK